MTEGYFVSAPLFDPCVNLAREDWLLHFTEQTGQPVLYLWQNNMFAVRAEIEVGFRADTDLFNALTATSVPSI